MCNMIVRNESGVTRVGYELDNIIHNLPCNKKGVTLNYLFTKCLSYQYIGKPSMIRN